MAYWLLKSEPSVYSWDDLRRDGKTFWDGVRNYQARNNLRAMAVGDEALFYHSNEGKAAVGIVRIVEAARPDPTVEKDELVKDGRNPWVGVTVAPVRALARPLALNALRGVAGLEQMALFRSARLSVQPMTAAEWRRLMELERGG